MIRRYGVLDENGTKITILTADAELLKTDWYPGFGASLIDEGEVEPDPLPAPPPKRPETWGKVLPQLDQAMDIGDVIDAKTLKVTRKIEQAPVDDAAVQPDEVVRVP